MKIEDLKVGLQGPTRFDLIVDDGETKILTIKPDGELWVNPDYETDEAAKVFWDAVRRLNPCRHHRGDDS